MLGPFIDTLVICTLTGLVIVCTGAFDSHPADVTGAALTSFAFSQVLGVGGAWVVGISLALFAFSTTIGWSYYGDRCAKFLFGPRAVLPYRIVYTLMVIVGTGSIMLWSVLTKGFKKTQDRYLATGKTEKGQPVRKETVKDRQTRRVMGYAVPVAVATWLVMLFNLATLP